MVREDLSFDSLFLCVDSSSLETVLSTNELFQSLNPFDETMFSDIQAGTDVRNNITKAQSRGQCIKMEMNCRTK